MIDCGIAYGLIQSGSRHTAHTLSSVNLQKFFFSIPTVVRGDRGTDFTSAGHIRIIAAILDHSAGNLRFPAHDIRHFRGVWDSFAAAAAQLPVVNPYLTPDTPPSFLYTGRI